jgi:hypothetical protein
VNFFPELRLRSSVTLLLASSLAGGSAERSRELAGIDLAAYPLFVAAMRSKSVAWSDKHISTVTGDVTIGLAVPLGAKPGVVVAELPLVAPLSTAPERHAGSLAAPASSS